IIMYEDQKTNSMKRTIDETEHRRKHQITYNEKHNITPKTIHKEVRDEIRATVQSEEDDTKTTKTKSLAALSKPERKKVITKMQKEMREAAKALDFERAAELRDIVLELKAEG